jgi:thioredoxin reductase
MHGYLSRDGMPPVELLAAGRAEIAAYGVQVVAGRVTSVDAGFSVRLDDGQSLSARRVLFATGSRDELPELPAVRERWGRDFLHCPYCHGWEVRDQPIGVLGWGAGSVQHALLVRQWSDDVIFFAHTLEPSAEEMAQLAARGIETVTGIVKRLVVENDRLMGIEFTGGRLMARTALFVRPLNVPNGIELLTGLGCQLDDAGFVVVDATGRTSATGVWAAGNVVDPRLQVISSAGAGSVAAIAINADLVREDAEHAMAGTRRAAASRPQLRPNGEGGQLTDSNPAATRAAHT